jgi:hypothetical protein
MRTRRKQVRNNADNMRTTRKQVRNNADQYADDTEASAEQRGPICGRLRTDMRRRRKLMRKFVRTMRTGIRTRRNREQKFMRIMRTQ